MIGKDSDRTSPEEKKISKKKERKKKQPKLYNTRIQPSFTQSSPATTTTFDNELRTYSLRHDDGDFLQNFIDRPPLLRILPATSLHLSSVHGMFWSSWMRPWDARCAAGDDDDLNA
jgi:hypothetical protein